MTNKHKKDIWTLWIQPKIKGLKNAKMEAIIKWIIALYKNKESMASSQMAPI